METTTPNIKTLVNNDEKRTLRRIRRCPEKVKTAIYDGCLNPLYANQFHTDLGNYGLWEALLYVQGYEDETPPKFKQGTAIAALNASGVLPSPTST